MKVFQTASDKFVGSVILYKGDNDTLYKNKELTKEVTDEELLELFKTNNVLVNENGENDYTLKKIISVTVNDDGTVTYSTGSGVGPVVSNDVIFDLEIDDSDNYTLTSSACNKTYSEIVEMFTNANITGRLNIEFETYGMVQKYLAIELHHNDYGKYVEFRSMMFEGYDIQEIVVKINEDNEITATVSYFDPNTPSPIG